MKQLEIKTNKRLLIVEGNEIELSKEGIIYKDENSHVSDLLEGDFKFICKGPDFTEDIAKGFQHKNMGIAYNGEYLSAIEEFKFHISNHGYHWGENPVKFKENEINWEKRHKNRIDWERAELITFNPSKCIIFEIV
ncbi:hypothetical protein ABE425_04765 [Chryseobacterium cucumeris]|uniref:hypothetical protein n=1 Tax=Chryseobacterium cucumeris TaxID=1813611 RepID=UPI003208526D